MWCIFYCPQQFLPTFPENHDTKEDFCFLNQGSKTKFFLAVKVKKDFNMIHISLKKQLCCSCFDIKLFSLILIGVSFYNSVVFFFFLWIDILRIVLHLLNVVLNIVLYQKLYCCIPPNIKYRSCLTVILCFFFLFAIDVCLLHWTLLIKHV